jgi:hypothetical protein
MSFASFLAAGLGDSVSAALAKPVPSYEETHADALAAPAGAVEPYGHAAQLVAPHADGLGRVQVRVRDLVARAQRRQVPAREAE